jgi:beta-ribofuranosylaminobenzene 5'-phosphate synthase
MAELRLSGASGVGMSSFGPTIYALTDTNTKNLEKAAREVLSDLDVEIIITSAHNSGAQIL